MKRNKVIDRVFRENSKKIIFVIKSAGCEQQDVEDVLHQTMLMALENFGQLKDHSKAVSWCIKIAINITYRKLQQEGRTCSADFFNEQEFNQVNERCHYNLTQYDMENVELRMDLKNIMDKISPKYSTPLQMKAVYGFKYEEIAETLGLRVGTVRSRINRAKKLLEKIIEKENEKEKEPDEAVE